MKEKGGCSSNGLSSILWFGLLWQENNFLIHAERTKISNDTEKFFYVVPSYDETSFQPPTSFQYLSVTCNAFIACYIRRKKYLIGNYQK